MVFKSISQHINLFKRSITKTIVKLENIIGVKCRVIDFRGKSKEVIVRIGRREIIVPASSLKFRDNKQESSYIEVLDVPLVDKDVNQYQVTMMTDVCREIWVNENQLVYSP